MLLAEIRVYLDQPMTSFQIKLLAILLMTIDHIGLMFFPEIGVLRFIGRLAFPLFAWQLALGATHSDRPRKYLIRLAIFGLISQPIFHLFLSLAGADPWSLNIFFTLALGLGTIMFIRWFNELWLQSIAVIVSITLATVLPFDYGALGIISILLFYLTLSSWKLMLIGQAAAFGLIGIITWLRISVSSLTPVALSQPIAPLSVLIIALYNGQQGRKATYLFYAFYPLHLLVLSLIALWLL